MENNLQGLHDLSTLLASIASIFGNTLTVVSTIFIIIGAIIAFLLSVAQWLTLAIPLYKLAVKAGRKNAWVAWIPLVGNVYTMMDIAGDKEIPVFKKFVIKNRIHGFWLWVLIVVLGNVIWTATMAILAAAVSATGIGSLVSPAFAILEFVPTILMLYLEVVFLKDLLDVFKPDKAANKNTAILLTILDSVLPYNFVRAFYLFSLLKLDPLPVTEETPEAVPEIIPDSSCENS